MSGERASRYAAGIIGCGDIGYRFDRGRDAAGALTHFRALQDSADFRIAGIADTDEALRDEINSAHGVAAYPDYRQMLSAQRPEIVVVATPDDTHAAILADLPAYRPKLVFCEKPLAATAVEMEALVARYNAAGIGLAVNYTRRFLPDYADIGRRIASGDMGRVYSVVIYYSRGFVHNACHYLDLLRWWFGDAKDFVVEGARAGLTTADPTLSVLLRYEENLEVRLVGLESDDILVNEIDIIGTAGRIRIGTLDDIEVQRPQRHPEYQAFRCYVAQERQRINRLLALPRAFDNLCAWLDGKAELLTPARDSIAVQQAIENILKRGK